MKNFKIIENIVIRNYTKNISQLMTDESNILLEENNKKLFKKCILFYLNISNLQNTGNKYSQLDILSDILYLTQLNLVLRREENTLQSTNENLSFSDILYEIYTHNNLNYIFILSNKLDISDEELLDNFVGKYNFK